MNENEISPAMQELIAERAVKASSKPTAIKINDNVSPAMRELIKDRTAKNK